MTDSPPQYYKEVFERDSEHEARGLILTEENGTTSEERWEKETAFLRTHIGEMLQPSSGDIILDFGCGIGRMSKELISLYGCYVAGLDTSASMRRFALKYVDSNRFSVFPRELFAALAARGMQVDGCIVLWVLQHCLDADLEVALIKAAVKQGGLLYVLNNYQQAIPTDKGWATAGVDILALLSREFSLQVKMSLPMEHTTQGISANSFIAVLRNDKK